LCFNGSKARFGRLVLPRRANVLGSLTRAFRADRWRLVTGRASTEPVVRAQFPKRPIEIASTDCHVEWQRLSRSKTPSIDKEPGRLFTPVAIHLQDSTTDHDAPSPIADSPRRARPCPPLSAATENGFLGPTPLADFCNHFTEHGHTERSTIPRTKLAFSALFAASADTGAASGTAPGSSFGAARLTSEDVGRTGRKAPSQLARGGARGRLEYLPGTSCHRPALRGTC
jgi:hypothetical protein